MKFSLKIGVVNRFYMMVEYRCFFFVYLRDMFQVKCLFYYYDEMFFIRKVKDEKVVIVVESLIESWNNFFIESKQFVSIFIVIEVFEDVM